MKDHYKSRKKKFKSSLQEIIEMRKSRLCLVWGSICFIVFINTGITFLLTYLNSSELIISIVSFLFGLFSLCYVICAYNWRLTIEKEGIKYHSMFRKVYYFRYQEIQSLKIGVHQMKIKTAGKTFTVNTQAKGFFTLLYHLDKNRLDINFHPSSFEKALFLHTQIEALQNMGVSIDFESYMNSISKEFEYRQLIVKPFQQLIYHVGKVSLENVMDHKFFSDDLFCINLGDINDSSSYLEIIAQVCRITDGLLPLDELKDLNCYKTNVSSIIEITFCLGGESFRWQFKSWKEAPDPVFFVKMNHLLEDLTDKKLMYAQERSNVLITFVSQENALLLNTLCHISLELGRDEQEDYSVNYQQALDKTRDYFIQRATTVPKEDIPVCPDWLAKDKTNLLNHLYQEIETLYLNGKVVYGCVVQANSILFDPDLKHVCAPALIVYSPDPYYNTHLFELEEIARILFLIKKMRKNSLIPEMLDIRSIVKREKEYVYHILLPKELTHGKDVYLTTILIDTAHLPYQNLSNIRFFPLLILPDSLTSSMILPYWYWDEFLK